MASYNNPLGPLIFLEILVSCMKGNRLCHCVHISSGRLNLLLSTNNILCWWRKTVIIFPRKCKTSLSYHNKGCFLGDRFSINPLSLLFVLINSFNRPLGMHCVGKPSTFGTWQQYFNSPFFKFSGTYQFSSINKNWAQPHIATFSPNS